MNEAQAIRLNNQRRLKEIIVRTNIQIQKTQKRILEKRKLLMENP